MKLETLRAANNARQELWPGVEKADLPFRGLELAGEVGELCNLVKKLHRLESGIAGNAATGEAAADALRVAIFEELGDVQVSLDLLARELGVDLAAATVAKFNLVSSRVGIPVWIGIDHARPEGDAAIIHTGNPRKEAE